MVLLRDVCLCTIVRDEVMNPAGGIVDFVDSIVPYVQRAVIVDTGSKDGTRFLLDEEANHHPNLRVYDCKFRGFSDARNFSLDKARLEWALVLDADKRLPIREIELVKQRFADLRTTFQILRFNFKHLTPPGSSYDAPAHTKRLFKNNGEIRFYDRVWEKLDTKDYSTFYQSIATIYHFLPNQEGRVAKSQWYAPTEGGEFQQPYSFPGFQSWKELNSQREKHR